jgi:hypothetical protein
MKHFIYKKKKNLIYLWDKVPDGNDDEKVGNPFIYCDFCSFYIL